MGNATLRPNRVKADSVNDFHPVVGPLLRNPRTDLPVLSENAEVLTAGIVRLFKCTTPTEAAQRRVCPCLDTAAAEVSGGRPLF